MHVSQSSGDRRCQVCGAPLDSGGGEKCLRCALGHALENEAAPTTTLPFPAEQPSHRTISIQDTAFQTSLPRSFGDYELLEEIGRGGMGIVYKARQVSLDRLVAVKMLLFGPLASPEYVQRFRTEAAAAASLQHPNIVAIHEVGFRESQHFFAMDYVAGRSLAEVVRDGVLPPRRAATYVKIIAEAIEYAHARGILHRDLKPSNVLTDEHDQPKVTDFGLAKRLEKDTELTLSGQVLGSPNYMPPEQAAANRGLVGKRSDVYSLGAILYHLLTGRAPFVAPTVGETLQQVQTAEPVSPTVLNPHLPRDLKTICLKCLEKEPARRYQTAQGLADDLGRFLNDETILARPIGPAGRAWRWCRRKPVVASLIAAVALSLLIGFAGVTWQGQQASKARDLAQGRLYAAQMKLAHATFKDGKIGGALELLKSQRPRSGETDFRGFDWRYLYRLCLSSLSQVVATNASGFQSVDYSPDGRTLAFGTGDGYVDLFDAQTRQRIKRWPVHAGVVDHLAFHPRNSNWLATVSGDDCLLKLWDIMHEHAVLSTQSPRGGLWSHFAFSPEGRFLANRATNGQSIDLWEFQVDAPGATPTLTLKTNLGYSGPTAFSPDGRTLAVCNLTQDAQEFRLALYDLVDDVLKTNLSLAHADLIMSVAFSPAGSTLATGGGDERVVLWDVKEQRPLWTKRSDFILVTSVAFAPDGRTLFASSWDQNIRSWNVADPTQSNTWPGHCAGVNQLAVAPDGRSLASASSDGTARLWTLPTAGLASNLAPPDEFTTLFPLKGMRLPEGESVAIFGVVESPTQDRAVATENRWLLLCDLETGIVHKNVASTNVFKHVGTALMRPSFSPDGRELAVGNSDGGVAFLAAATLLPLRELTNLHTRQITHIAYALNGAVLVTGGGFGTGIKLTDVASGRAITNFSGVEGNFPLQPLAVSRDGKRLATGSPEGRVRVWDIATLRVVASSPQKMRLLHAVAFAPDGKLLAFSDERGTIFLWDLTQKQSLPKLIGHAGPATALTFSPDGRTLASGGMDHTIRLWHPEIDQEVAILKGHSDWVWCVAFAGNGNALLSGSRDGTLKLWRALSFEQAGTQRHPGAASRHK